MAKTKISRAGKPASKQRGFTYAMALVAVAVMSLVAGAAATLASSAAQADREAELLFRGLAYREAIKSYYDAAIPVGRPAIFPRSLEDLINDPRFPNKRHIRKLYADPFAVREISAMETWTLVRAADGGIAGVASKSTATPRKQANFEKGLEKFQGAKSYTEWVFEYVPVRTNQSTRPPQRFP